MENGLNLRKLKSERRILVGTNLTSIGVNYSQSGGFSANYLGLSISSSDVRFSPSVSVSGAMDFQRRSSTPPTNDPTNTTDPNPNLYASTDGEPEVQGKSYSIKVGERELNPYN